MRIAHLFAQVSLLVAATFSLTACSAYAAPQRGATVLHRNLGELVQESGIILRGHVISARVEPHPQFPALSTVVVTLQVDEALKGQPGNTYSFRQFLWDPQDRANAGGYQKGGHLLLCLTTPNAQGLSSPAGLDQGEFQVRADATGKLMAANGRNNIGLFNGLAARASAKGIRLTPRASNLVSAPASGAIALDDLRDLISQFAGTN